MTMSEVAPIDKELYLDVTEKMAQLVRKYFPGKILDNFQGTSLGALDVNGLRTFYLNIACFLKVNNVIKAPTMAQLMDPEFVTKQLVMFRTSNVRPLTVSKGYIKGGISTIGSKEFNNEFKVHHLGIYNLLVRFLAEGVNTLEQIPFAQIHNAIIHGLETEKKEEKSEYFISYLNFLINKYNCKIYPGNPKSFPHQIKPAGGHPIIYLVVHNNETGKHTGVIIDVNVNRYRIEDRLKSMIKIFDIE